MQVFRALLGKDYDGLPAAVRDFHDMVHDHYQGTAFSGGTDNVLTRSLRRIFGFPSKGDALPVDIWLGKEGGRDCWRRKFGARRFSSSFHASPDGVLDERFGPFRFGFRLRVADNRMYWDFVRWGIGPLPLPYVLGPKIETYETEDAEGAFEFYSHADFPLIGRLVHYHGHVTPAP